jgi:transposase
MEVVEHRLGVIECCGQRHIGSFPSQVGRPVQYGSQTKPLSVLLNNDYKVPLGKIEQLMGDVCGCSFNESTSMNANAAMYEALGPLGTQIKAEILAHFDETGMRVEKSPHWFHVASNLRFTYLFVHKKRGREALESDGSLLKDFRNRAIHDCWGPYFGFEGCAHGLCELANLVEKGAKWAAQMHRFMLDLYRAGQKATGSATDRETWEREFKYICQMADAEEPPPMQGKRGRPKNS